MALNTINFLNECTCARTIRVARLGLAKPSGNASNVIHYCSMTTCQINENVIYSICQVSMADLIKSLVLTETKPAPQMLSTIKTESRLNESERFSKSSYANASHFTVSS